MRGFCLVDDMKRRLKRKLFVLFIYFIMVVCRLIFENKHQNELKHSKSVSFEEENVKTEDKEE